MSRSLVRVFRSEFIRGRRQSSISDDDKVEKVVVVPLHTYLHEMEVRLRVYQKESEARLMTFITNTVSLFSKKLRADTHKNNIILLNIILFLCVSALNSSEKRDTVFVIKVMSLHLNSGCDGWSWSCVPRFLHWPPSVKAD